MQTEQTSEAPYQKGFNEGYLIAKYEPSLAEKLANVKSNSMRIEGFRDGRQELIIEDLKQKKYSAPWLARDFSKTEERGDLSRTKENKDMDIERE